MRFLLLFILLMPFPAQSALPVSDSYADVVEDLLPSVVSVSATKITGQISAELLTVPHGSPFEEFFREFYKGGNLNAHKAILLGSGFIYDDKGHIVTSSHVVENMPEVMVTLNDGSVLKGRVLGKDSKTDLAVLKVDTDKTLVPVKMGASDHARVGDLVFAIGNPFGLGNTVTSGIISARSRDIQVGPYDDFIQTDAAINRGNSGGPLFNSKGEWIGVNTAIFSPSGGSVGIAFAVPSKMAAWVADSLIRDGVIKRGRLGLKIQTVSSEIASSLGLKKAGGALVAGVDPNSAAAKSNIQAGDVILAFDGKEVTTMRSLPRFAAETPVGTTVQLKIWRDGKEMSIPLMIEEMIEPGPVKPKQISEADRTRIEQIDILGIAVADLSPSIRQKYRLPKSAAGVIVTAVQPGSDAAVKGLRMGDLIIELDKKPVYSTSRLAKWKEEIAELGQTSAFLLIERGGERFFVVVKYVLPAG